MKKSTWRNVLAILEIVALVVGAIALAFLVGSALGLTGVIDGL